MADNVVSILETDFPPCLRVTGAGLYRRGSGGCGTSVSEVDGGDVGNNQCPRCFNIGMAGA